MSPPAPRHTKVISVKCWETAAPLRLLEHTKGTFSSQGNGGWAHNSAAASLGSYTKERPWLCTVKWESDPTATFKQTFTAGRRAQEVGVKPQPWYMSLQGICVLLTFLGSWFHCYLYRNWSQHFCESSWSLRKALAATVPAQHRREAAVY